MTTLMALDASTTTIGIAIFTFDLINQVAENIKLIHVEYYKPNKLLSELDWMIESKNYILNIADKFNVTEFAIEEYIKFMKGASGAATVIPLAIWNRTLCLSIYEKYKYYPNIINVMKIRHFLKKIANMQDLPKKEDLPLILEKSLNFTFPWVYNKNNKIKDESYDMADAISCGYCHIINIAGGSSDNNKVRNTKNKRKKNKKKSSHNV